MEVSEVLQCLHVNIFYSYLELSQLGFLWPLLQVCFALVNQFLLLDLILLAGYLEGGQSL